jgi:parallel beta-helix repeat protein
MKNHLLVVGIIFLFFGTSFTSISGIQINNQTIKTSNRGNTLYVGGSGEGNYTTIQSAINDANNGDTVFVFDDSSPYKENLIVNKSIDLIGENKNTTVIDGDFIDDTIWIYKESYVSIIEFTVINSIDDSYHAGIHVKDSADICISNCIIKYNDCGIRLTRIDRACLSNCIISNNYGSSILSDDSFHVDINQCEIYSNGKIVPEGYYSGGISIGAEYESSNINVSNCYIKNNIWSGISIGVDCFNINIFNNVICGNTFYGIGVFGDAKHSIEITITNNEITGNGNELDYGGILLDDCFNRVYIKHNIISSNKPYGVFCLRSSGNIIIENNFINNEESASFDNNHISHKNTWDKNYWDRPRLLPKPILGIIDDGNGVVFNWVEFDWHPAKKPYDITTTQGCGIV